MKNADKNIILFDEMKIKSGLVFSKTTGKVIGFTEVGEVDEELSEFERKINDGKTKQFATHVLCFMARALFKRFNYPIGYFADKGFDSDQFYPVVWEATMVMGNVGMFLF